MEPHMLIDQSLRPMAAPYWFVELFAWLGFTLHMVPMNLWYAGLLVALGLHLRRNEHARRFAGRMLQQMPIIVAIGVNFGVVPLLFLQLAYYWAFYPATILMAWFWMGIIGLLIPAYYGVYIYAWGIRKRSGVLSGGPTAMDDKSSAARPLDRGESWRTVAGWIAALLFLSIGFIFANGMSLLEHWQRWDELWRTHSVAGAALGTALNVGDPTLWPRWLLMFGLALGTTAVWVLIDAFWLDYSDEQSQETAYRRWAVGFARKLYTVGMIWAAAAGTWYVFGTWPAGLRGAMFGWPWAPLTVLTAIATGLPWLLLMPMGDRFFANMRARVAVIALCQFGVLGINAASRQVVQNLDLCSLFDVLKLPTEVQWSPLAMFLIAFVIGLAIIGWMLLQVRRSQLSENRVD